MEGLSNPFPWKFGPGGDRGSERDKTLRKGKSDVPQTSWWGSLEIWGQSLGSQDPRGEMKAFAALHRRRRHPFSHLLPSFSPVNPFPSAWRPEDGPDCLRTPLYIQGYKTSVSKL